MDKRSVKGRPEGVTGVRMRKEMEAEKEGRRWRRATTATRWKIYRRLMEMVVLKLGRGKKVRGRPNSGSSSTSADPCLHRRLTQRKLHRRLDLARTSHTTPRDPIGSFQASSGTVSVSRRFISDCIESTTEAPLDISYGISASGPVDIHLVAPSPKVAKKELLGLSTCTVELSITLCSRLDLYKHYFTQLVCKLLLYTAHVTAPVNLTHQRYRRLRRDQYASMNMSRITGGSAFQTPSWRLRWLLG